MLLKTIDWDKGKFKIDEPEWKTSEGSIETSKLEIMPDEDETSTDQIESETYFDFDFGLILDAFETENRLSLEFPTGFQVNQFMETLKEKFKLNSDCDTKEKLAERQIQLKKLSDNNQLMSFYKISGISLQTL